MRHRNPGGDAELRARALAHRHDRRDPIAAQAYAAALERSGNAREAVKVLKAAGLILPAIETIWRYDLQRTRWYRSKSSLTDIPEDEVPVGAPAYLDTLDVFYYTPSRGVVTEAQRKYGLMGHGHMLLQSVGGLEHESDVEQQGTRTVLQPRTPCEVVLSPDGGVREVLWDHDRVDAYAVQLDVARDPILAAYVQRYYAGPQGGWHPESPYDDLKFALDAHWLLGWPTLPPVKIEVQADPNHEVMCVRCERMARPDDMHMVPDDREPVFVCYPCLDQMEAEQGRRCDHCQQLFAHDEVEDVPWSGGGASGIESLCRGCRSRRRR
jgi:hypothetical protein